ncbi:hypothetical protein PM082_006048 [Marasmius tenuissimus]|nr:hypothetical protein PM082_006048 [Marasmius tenuissimus]
MGQNPSKGSKHQGYSLPNSGFYPPPPVLPYQSQHYAYPQPTLGHHVITPYPMMMVDGNQTKRRKTRRKSGGTRRRPTRKPVPLNPGRPSSRAGGTTMLRVTNSTAGDQEDETPDAGPSVQPMGHLTPGPGRYNPPDPDADPPVVPSGPYPPFDEAQPIQPRPPGSRTPYPHAAPSSIPFTPHTQNLRNFPVDSDEDDDDDEPPPVIPTHLRARSHGRSQAGSVSGHGHGGDIRRTATPGIALARRATTGTVPDELFQRHPLPRPPDNLTQSTPWRKLRQLDMSSIGHEAGASSHGHGSASTSHGHNTAISHANVPASSHGHSRVRSIDTHQPARVAVQPPAQPPQTSDHHRSKTVGSFFRRGGIGAGVSNVGGGIWRRVSQRKRHPDQPRVDLDEEFVQVEPPTPVPPPAPAPAPAPPEGTITPFTLTEADLRPATSRPVTPAPPPPVLDPVGVDPYSGFGVPPPGDLDPPPVIPPASMTPGSIRATAPGPIALGLSQSSRPVTPIGISGTATPGIATPALGLTQPPPEHYRPPTAASSTYAPAHSAYDTVTRPTSYAPQPPQPPPPPSSQPQYSTAAPPVVFTQSQPPLNAFLNHSQFRVIHTNPIAPGHPPTALTYSTAAHLFEALKFLPRHPEHAYAISQTPNIADVYRMSSQWGADIRPDWGSVFLGQMEEVLMAKFRQHHQLRLLLFSTGVTGSVGPDDRKGRELVYEDDRDKFWGRGLDGVGRNELGKALMRVRERLITEGYVANLTG